jgi:hypothetical protein
MVNDSVPLKRCSRKTECLHPEQQDGGWLPATTVYFMLHKGKLYSQCHECRRAAKREAHIRHTEHNNARSKAWYGLHIDEEHEKRRLKNAANPQPNRDRVKAWRKANPSKRKTANSRYAKRHPDVVAIKSARWRIAHPGLANQRKNAARKADPDKIRAADRAAYAKNPGRYREAGRIKGHNRRAKLKEVGGSFTAADIALQRKSQTDRKGVFRCWWCGKPIAEFETLSNGKIRIGYDIDHRISPDRGGTNDPSNLVLSCPVCNQSKQDKLPAEWSDRLL